MFEADTDPLDSILQELKNCNEPVAKYQPNVKFELAEAPQNDEELHTFIVENGARTVNATQDIISTLLEQIQCNPEAELITSVAEMVSANNKALETLAKLHLHREKLKQAKELEIFKQKTKAAIAATTTTTARPIMTREAIRQALESEES